MTDYHLHLRPVGDGPAPEIRIHRLLKIALPAFGLQCVAVERNGTAQAVADAEAGIVSGEGSALEIEQETHQ